jgi:hypothetical protein
MKKLFWGVLILIPALCNGNNSLDFDLIRTEETPGFFSVTVFPDEKTQPIEKEIVFVKNFSKLETKKYAPILSFLTELGATIIESPPLETNTKQMVSLGDSFENEKNFSLNETQNPLESFEEFSLQNLQPVFFKNIHAEFGGNVSQVEQFKTNIIGDTGVTFIGKFEKDMRTRMLLQADREGEERIQFELPLDLSDTTLSASPVANELPQLWEQLHHKKREIPSTKINFTFFPWMLAGIGILLLVGIFIRRSLRKYNQFLEDQDSIQEELPWQQIKKTEDTYTNPFEIE